MVRCIVQREAVCGPAVDGTGSSYCSRASLVSLPSASWKIATGFVHGSVRNRESAQRAQSARRFILAFGVAR